MNRVICFLIILNLLLNVGCSSQGGSKLKDLKNKASIRPVSGFECDDFEYNISPEYFVDEQGNPYWTQEEISKMLHYGIKSNSIGSLINGNDTNKYGLRYLLPRIRNIIDTVWYDSIIFNCDKINYLGLEKSKLYDLISSDAVILGHVIDKRYVRDISKCYLYKTEYKVKVNEIIHSYFEINKDDEVL
jgi:hypothetical protein